MLSPATINILLQLIPTINPMNEPDPVAVAQLLVTARRELLAYAETLNADQEHVLEG